MYNQPSILFCCVTNNMKNPSHVSPVKKTIQETPNRTNNRTLGQIIEAFPTFQPYIIDHIDKKIKNNEEIVVVEI